MSILLIAAWQFNIAEELILHVMYFKVFAIDFNQSNGASKSLAEEYP